MKTSFLTIAIFCGFLTACGSSDVSNDPNTLSSGMMEPVDGSGATQGSYSWPADIQSTSMPEAMK